MKKFICIISLLAVLVFTACGEKPKNNETPTAEPPRLVYQRSFNWNDITSLIAEEYSAFDGVAVRAVDEGIWYFCTLKGDEKYTEDIFAYNLDSCAVEHIADVSALKATVADICESDGKIYLCTYPTDSGISLEGYDLYLCGDNGAVLFLGKAIDAIEFNDGIACVECTDDNKNGYYDMEEHKIVHYDGTHKKTVVNSQGGFQIRGFFADNKMIFLALDKVNNAYYGTQKNGWIATLSSIPHREVEFMKDAYAYKETDADGLEKIIIKDYSNDEIGSIEAGEVSFLTSDNDSVFVYSKDNVWYQCFNDTANRQFVRVKLKHESIYEKNTSAPIVDGGYWIFPDFDGQFHIFKLQKN